MSDPVADNVLDTIGDQATGRAVPRALRPFRAPTYRRLAVSPIWWARLPHDELAHPLRDDEPVS